MAESIVKDFKGKMDWVYVGKSEAPKPKDARADTAFHEYMRRVLDVATPTAVMEVGEFAAAQEKIADVTSQEIIPASLQKDMQDKTTWQKKWLEWEKKSSTPDHQNRLGKLLTSATYMLGSFATNYGSEMLANLLYRNSTHPWFRPETGNKRMLDAGWEYITDFGIEKTADWTAKKLANREDIGFVSPLSRMLGKIANTVMTISPTFDRTLSSNILKKSAWNPGFIEGTARFFGALPGFGWVKELYGVANKQIMKGEGIIPLGTDLAFNMLFAKMYATAGGGGAPAAKE